MSVLGPLQEHIKKCVAAVDGKANAGDVGSGFFVDSDLVLTCAHVAGEGAKPVKVTLVDGTPLNGTVESFSPVDEHDVALIRLNPPEAATAAGQPAMLIAASAPDVGRAYAPGFPTYVRKDHSMASGEYQLGVEFSFSTSRSSAAEMQVQLTKAPAGGQSGSAVISFTDPPQPGQEPRVIGIVNYRLNDPSGLNAGGATPMSVAIAQLHALDTLSREPPAAATEWIRLTEGEGAVNALPRPQIALSISGEFTEDSCRWGVASPDRALAPSQTVEAFGEVAGQAVFAWLSRRRPKTSEDFTRCGRLLGKVLLENGVGKVVTDHNGYGRPFDLRLQFTGAIELQDAPWELALIPGTDQALATRPDSSLVRIDRNSTLPPRDVTDRLRVLAIGPHGGEPNPRRSREGRPDTNMPGTDPVPRIDFSRRKEREPIEESLKIATDDGGIPDVVHYAGFAWRQAGQEPEFLVRPDRGEDFYMSLPEFAASCGEAGVRVLIVQSRSPRLRMVWGPPPLPSTFAGLLASNLQAIVLTQFEVSDMALRIFNRIFYQQIDHGARVEDAVQMARLTLKQIYRSRDEPGSYGAFVLITGGASCGPLLTTQDTGIVTHRAHAKGLDPRATGVVRR
jgi:hypothetical protein